MERQGIIRKSNSRYASPIVVVAKKPDKEGKVKYRVCVDYRALNDITVDDKYPLPNIESILDKLGRSQYFSTLDLAKGYHQIKVHPDDIHKTAFVTPNGLYEYTRMPFGLKNAPATFQRLMNEILREYIGKICTVYLDDILIFSTSLEEHISSLEQIFQKLAEHNLKIQLSKCSFLKKNTEYLGHILTSEGMKPNPSKIEVIQKYPLPQTIKQLQGFLGSTGYYRKFIADYSKIAYPMVKYLKKNMKINCNDPEYIQAFERLKANLTKHPILKFPDFNKQFSLFTDASNFALGAVLTQEGQPVCYASRTLNDHEKDYSTTDKEFLAIVWATTYFRPYLWGQKFKIITDHMPVKYLNKKYNGKEFSQRVQRGLLKLQEFEFEMEYIKGKENKIADFLSRIPKDINETSATVHSADEQLLDHIQIKEGIVNLYQTQLILSNSVQSEIKIQHNKTIIQVDMTKDDNYWRDLFQRTIKSGTIGIYSEVEDTEYNKVQKVLIEMYGNGKEVTFYKLTKRARDLEKVEDAHKQISLYHIEESNHSGIVETYYKLKNKIYFPKLIQEISRVIGNCQTCQEGKYDRKPIRPKLRLTETPVKGNDVLHMDVYHFNKLTYLTFIDKFTKKAYAYNLSCKNWTSKLECIDEQLSKFGKPRKIICDNEFNSENIKEYFREEGIEIHMTKPNSHTGNSDIERFHSTLLEILLTIKNKDISTNRKIHRAISIYNSRYHSTIGISPNEAENANKTDLRNRIEARKKQMINKRNISRENYDEKRKEGYIRNYKHLRHKNETYYRKHNLQNVDPTNIKRPNKFADNLVPAGDPPDDVNEGNRSNSNNNTNTNQ